MNALRVTTTNGRVRFAVRVQPRASNTGLVGVHGDALKIRLSAAPVDGAANDAVVKFLAETFAVGRHAVRILAGESSRSKIVEIEGITERAVLDLAKRSGR